MRAVIYQGIGQIVVEDRPMPEMGPADVLVKNMRTGICGTDISAYTKGGDQLGIFPGSPVGHEFVSEVVEVGELVTDPRIVPGLRVFVNAATSKRSGQGRSQLEITDSAGGMSQFISVQDAEIDYNLFPLADNVSFDKAVVIEPFSVANRAVNIAQPKPGERAIIFGGGTVGLGALAVLKAKGVEDVIVVDIVDKKLDVVTQLGGIPVNATDTDVIAFAAERFGTVTNFIDEQRVDADIFIDSAGVPSAVPDYLRGGKPGSRMVLLALPPFDLKIPQTNFVMCELALHTSLAYHSQDIAEVVAHLADELYDPTPVITHHFPQEQAVEAYKTMIEHRDEAIKVVIDVHP